MSENKKRKIDPSTRLFEQNLSVDMVERYLKKFKQRSLICSSDEEGSTEIFRLGKPERALIIKGLPKELITSGAEKPFKLEIGYFVIPVKSDPSEEIIEAAFQEIEDKRKVSEENWTEIQQLKNETKDIIAQLKAA